MISFVVKVTSVGQHLDMQGIEYVCVEFSWKPPSIPRMMPVGTPEDVSQLIGGLQIVVKEIPGMHQMMGRGSPRLVLFLTLEEWSDLSRKFTIRDSFTISLDENGRLVMEAE